MLTLRPGLYEDSQKGTPLLITEVGQNVFRVSYDGLNSHPVPMSQRQFYNPLDPARARALADNYKKSEATRRIGERLDGLLKMVNLEDGSLITSRPDKTASEPVLDTATAKE